MADEAPDIYSVLELFLRENLSTKYDPTQLDELVEEAKATIRERMEKDTQKGGDEIAAPQPRKPLYVRDADIEDKLIESLKKRVEGKDKE